jgi:deoxyribodipyrimidine photolyase-related protein
MIILCGNMLFSRYGILPIQRMPPVFMAEDDGFCNHVKYHKHKLILVLAAMHHYRDALQRQGTTLEYWELDSESSKLSYEEKLLQAVRKYSVTTLCTYTIEDHRLCDRLQFFCAHHQLTLITYDSPLFLTTHAEFQDYRKCYKRLFMGDFYKFQRRRLEILLDQDGEPQSGQWSYDEQNRKPLPKKIEVPSLSLPTPTHHVEVVSGLVDRLFPDHPGQSQNFWLPVTHEDSMNWLHQFLSERFTNFGPYEDALSTKEPFVFHSVLSPMLNLGILTPQEVVDATLAYAANHDVPLNSLEGFIRQMIGWREYIRGVYHAIASTQRQQNALNHTRKLTADYDGTTGLVPDDRVIQSKTKGTD